MAREITTKIEIGAMTTYVTFTWEDDFQGAFLSRILGMSLTTKRSLTLELNKNLYQRLADNAHSLEFTYSGKARCTVCGALIDAVYMGHSHKIGAFYHHDGCCDQMEKEE